MAVCISALALIAAGPPAERIVAGDAVIPVTVAQSSGRLRIEPGAARIPLLTQPFAERAGLRGGMFGFQVLIGPIAVSGITAVTKIGLAAKPASRRVGWTARPYATGIDAVAGPGAFPEPVVRFILRNSLPGERTIAIPMVDAGGLFGGFGPLYGLIDVDGTKVQVRFDPYHAQTIATAGTAWRIARALGGTLTGVTSNVEIAYGIARPVRPMMLGRPLQIGPLAVMRLGVRTTDFGDASLIPDQARADPDEIIVTAKGKNNARFDRITLGRDQLDHCSSIVFDKAAKRILLTCATS